MIDKLIRILLIEDNPGDARLFEESLKNTNVVSFDVIIAESFAQAEAIFGRQHIDAVLMDLFLPDSSGLDTFHKIYSKAPEIPIVILSILDDEQTAIEAVKAGAQDYFVKGRVDINLLVSAIRYAIERKSLENLKNEFLRMASHEFRTPLAIIKEGINLLLDNVPGSINGKQEKILLISKDNIERLTRFVSDLLDLSKIETGKMYLRKDLTTVKELVKQIAFLFEIKIKNKGLAFNIEIPDKDIKLYIDIDKITHVFMNLLGNAVKFTEKGSIKILVEDRDDKIECSVADTGIGISQDKLANIFNKYTQLSYACVPVEKGSGLGLCIIKYLVEMHGGGIWAESEAGKGSVFHFTLPKYSFEQVIEESINTKITDAMQNKSEFSVVIISAADYVNLNLTQGSEKINYVLKDIEKILKEKILRKEDIILTGIDKIFVVLSYCSKENAVKVIKRLDSKIQDYLIENKITDTFRLKFSYAVFPNDAETYKGLMDKLNQV